MFVGDRETARRVFSEAWRKRRTGADLEPLEALVAAVIASHPEYQGLLLEDSKPASEWEFEGAKVGDNPFLHMGLHLAVQEQVSIDRPPGIAALHRQLCMRIGDMHSAEHKMMDCLYEALWNAQRADTIPDERAYLEQLRMLLK